MKRKIHREDILDAGKTLMFEKGYNATGIKDITDFIEIPKGSFYNHFKSKEEFGIEMLENYCKGGLEWHKELLRNPDKNPIERINQIYTENIRFTVENSECRLGCLMSNFSTEMADVNPNFQVLLEKYFEQIQDEIALCIKEGQEKNEINASLPADQLASFILNSWHGALVRMKARGNRDSLDHFMNSILQLLQP